MNDPRVWVAVAQDSISAGSYLWDSGVQKALDALRGVLIVHTPSGGVCSEDQQSYPCTTVQAIMDAGVR